MLITNFKNLVRNSLRKKALLIAEAGYAAIEIPRVIQEKIKFKQNQLVIDFGSINGTKKLKLDLNKYRKVFLVGVGKGSSLAVLRLSKILTPLNSRLAGGISLDVQIPTFKIKNPKSKIQFFTGTHPLPSPQNVQATQKIIRLAKNLNKDDLLIAFICGGGSALLCGSKEELKYSRTIFKNLTKAGADIFELNTVRKHLSEIKGGGLARMVYPATIVSLIVADVPVDFDNDLPRRKPGAFLRGLSMVASGPTVYDKTTRKNAEFILKKYNLQSTIHGLRFTETPKDKKYFQKVKNILFLSNHEPVLAMVEKAEKLGFKPKIYSFKLKGEAKKSLLPLIKVSKKKGVILAAGETTVTLGNRLPGKGGRNMEAMLGLIANNLITNNLIAISIASDGRDNTEAAGAIADFSTIEKIKKLNLNPKDYLSRHDSFNFFKKTGDLIFASPNSFNISDLMLVLRVSKE